MGIGMMIEIVTKVDTTVMTTETREGIIEIIAAGDIKGEEAATIIIEDTTKKQNNDCSQHLVLPTV